MIIERREWFTVGTTFVGTLGQVRSTSDEVTSRVFPAYGEAM